MGVLDDWVQLDDAMRITGKSKPTVYRWVAEDKVRTVKPGLVTWFNLSDLRAAKKSTRRGRPSTS